MNPIAKALKKKVVGVASDVISAPARYKAYKSGVQATKDVALLKRARGYDNAPDEANGGDAGRVRSLALDVKDRVGKKEDNSFNFNGKKIPFRNDRQKLNQY